MEDKERATYYAWYNFKKANPCTLKEFIDAVGYKPNLRHKLRKKVEELPKSLENIHWKLLPPDIPRDMRLKDDGDPLRGKVVGPMMYEFPLNHTMWSVLCTSCGEVSALLRPSEKNIPYCCFCQQPPISQRGVTKRERQSKKARVARIKRLLGTLKTNPDEILKEWDELKLINKRDRLRAKHKAERDKLRGKR